MSYFPLTSVTTLQGTNPWYVGNSSVQLVPGSQAIGSVAALQGTNPWIVGTNSGSVIATQIAGSVMNVNISGSVATVGTVAANQSVSGTVGASIIGLPFFGVAGSVAAVGSITALQGTSPWLITGSVATRMLTGVASTFLQAGVNAIGSVAVLQGTNPWLIGNSSVQLVPGSQAIGSVATLQGTNPWIVNVPTPSYIAYQLAGSVMATGVTVTTGPSSVQLLQGVAAIGSVAVLQGTNPWVTNIVQGSSSVYLQAGVNAIGSVATLQGTSPWLITGSVMNTMTRGVASVELMSTSASIMVNTPATFAANSAWSQNKSVMATGGLRNDTLASITAADNTYSPFAVGPSGETIVANSPITKWLNVTTSVMTGPSIAGFVAPGASIFNYVSGVQVTNPGTVAAHVAFYEGLGGVPASILFYAMAPAGGGSNMVFPNPIKTALANKAINASVSAHASVYVMMEGFTVKQLT